MLRLFEHLILLPACILARLTDDFICLFLAFSISWRPSSRALARAASSTLFSLLLFHPGRLRISLSPPALLPASFCLIILFLNGCTPFIDHFVDRLKEEKYG